MTDETTYLNQTQAASYISDRWKDMTPPELSIICKFNLGPRHIRRGNNKIFRTFHLDEWIAAQHESEAA